MIIIKTKKEIVILKQGGKILASILKRLEKEVRPGATTGQLENLACDLIKKAGGRPSFKGYKSMMETKAFPTALCTSINNEVVHAPALPSRKLSSGDIISIDIGMEYPFSDETRGYYTDMAATFPVGRITNQASKLIKATKKALAIGINEVKPGAGLNNIGRAIQKYVENKGFSVVRDLVGHGVGNSVHEEPQIPNFEIINPVEIILKPGMVLAIEPMVNIGSYKVKGSRDGFTILTADNSLSAHFEHTIAITETGYDILTKC